jgi:hypothetical protein
MIHKTLIIPECVTLAQMNLIFNARIVWRRLTTWTIAYLIGRYERMGSEEELFTRLNLETREVGDILQLIFGRRISEDYSNIINRYVNGLRDLITVQMEGDTEAVQRILDFLSQNIAEHASFLASVNPFVDEAEWRSMLDTYLQYTIELANVFVEGGSSIEATDRLTELTEQMSEYFAQRLFVYLTSGFQYVPVPQDEEQCITYEEMNEIYNIRMYYYELSNWVRAYMQSKLMGIGNEEEILARLKQVPLDYVNMLRKILGDSPAADEELRLQYVFIDLIGDLFNAQKEGNVSEIDRIVRLLYQNAYDRALPGPALTPFYSAEVSGEQVTELIRSTIQQSMALLAGDHARSLDIFSSLLDLAEIASDYFAQVLVQYIFSNQENNSAS